MTASVKKTVSRFARDTEGTTLVELTIVLPLLLLLVMGAVEFGRLGVSEAMAQKATELAVRTAAVRPAVCVGVPLENEPVTSSVSPPKFGTMCRVGGSCQTPTFPDPTVQGWACTLAESNASADEIWQTIAPLLPAAVARNNVRIIYTHDARLGFLGGPYTPLVTAEITGLEFEFITPLGALAELATLGVASGIDNSIPFPNMSASLPAEDLGHGIGVN